MATSASPSSDADSHRSSSTSSAITSITIQNIGSLVPIKLTTTNYLTWRALFAPIFRRYNLTGLIDGSMAAPPQFLPDASGNCTTTLNPDFVTWFENDQNILIWLNSTLSESLISYTVGVTSARELWAKLESRLATASQSHIHELRSRIRNLSKGESTAAQYLQKIEEIDDALASAGAPVDDSDLISVTLHGLPPEFDLFVDAIQFRLRSTTIDELHSLLLSKEIQLNSRKPLSSAPPFQAFSSSPGILPTPPQAFTAQNFANSTTASRGVDRNSRNYSSNRGNFRSNNNNNQRQFSYRPNQRPTYHNNRGGRHNFQFSSKKVPCQICRQFDHEAWDCPHRMNAHYGVKSSSSAMVANTSTSAPTWIVDSGVTSHMTNSYGNL
ncbi:hypothetical protein ACFX2B_013621 [Malus domestica]